MDERQARDSVSALEQIWETEILNQPEWVEALLPFDSVTVATAIVKYFESGVDHPDRDDFLRWVREEAARPPLAHAPAYEEESDQSSPYDDLGVEFVLQPWVKGWAVARYRHDDMRVFPQQKPGYDTAQIANEHHRTYVWSEQEPMPQEDIDRYIAEGATLTINQVFALMAS